MDFFWFMLEGLRVLVLVLVGSLLVLAFCVLLGVAGLLFCYHIQDKYEEDDGC